MDDNQRQQFEVKLLEKQQELIDKVKKSEEYGREAESEEESPDLVDKASSSYTKEFMFRLSNSDRQLLQMVNQAIDRVRNEEYGVCQNCEEPINEKRLEAVPWARLCRDCQQLQEDGKL